MRRADKRLRRWVPVVVLLAMVIAACSADSDDGLRAIGEDSGAVTATTAAGGAAPGPTTGDSGGDGTGTTGDGAEPARDRDEDLGNGTITPVVLPSDIGRDIIYTAEIIVAVNDVARAGEQANQALAGLGGFLFGQRTVGSPEPSSLLTFKVPPESFQEALARLGEIGEVRSQNISADDVTERVVDLESRINTAAASVERLRTLLAEAGDIEVIVALENELLARETELETLRGSLRTLQDQVALATILLQLTEAQSRPDIEVSITGYLAHDEGASCPGESEVALEKDTEATLCFAITNVGDTGLSDFEVRDPVLEITRAEDLIVVFGDLEGPIEPGESLMLAIELMPDRDLRTRTTVTATPVDDEGGPLPGTASTTVSFFVDSIDPGGIPSFAEGLEASWELLVDLGSLLLLVAGAALPFLWVPVLVVVALRMWRRNGKTAREAEVS